MVFNCPVHVGVKETMQQIKGLYLECCPEIFVAHNLLCVCMHSSESWLQFSTDSHTTATFIKCHRVKPIFSVCKTYFSLRLSSLLSDCQGKKRSQTWPGISFQRNKPLRLFYERLFWFQPFLSLSPRQAMAFLARQRRWWCEELIEVIC